MCVMRRRPASSLDCSPSGCWPAPLSPDADGDVECSVPVINLYGSASDADLTSGPRALQRGGQGRYRIVGNLLPSDADGQREQFVRRLAAKDDGMDILGLDVTWTAEFAEAGWIRELTGEQKPQATEDALQPPIDTATWKDKLYAIPQQHQRAAALVPQVASCRSRPRPGTRCSTASKELKEEGKPYVIGITGRAVRGPVVGFNTILVVASAARSSTRTARR